MKTYFNDIYLPISRGITGEIFGESQSHYSELINKISVKYEPEKPFGKWVVRANFFHNGQFKTFWFGKTRKEIKELISYINDFKDDPYLFLNQ